MVAVAFCSLISKHKIHTKAINIISIKQKNNFLHNFYILDDDARKGAVYFLNRLHVKI